MRDMRVTVVVRTITITLPRCQAEHMHRVPKTVHVQGKSEEARATFSSQRSYVVLVCLCVTPSGVWSSLGSVLVDINWPYHSRRSDAFTYCYVRLIAAIALFFILIPADNRLKPSLQIRSPCVFAKCHPA